MATGETKGETIGVWLPADLQAVFRQHVGFLHGAAGAFGVAAIREKLQREGAFKEQSTLRAEKLLKTVKPESLQLLAQIVELIDARGQAAVAAAIEPLAVAAVTAEK